jgi:hypothetical protein
VNLAGTAFREALRITSIPLGIWRWRLELLRTVNKARWLRPRWAPSVKSNADYSILAHLRNDYSVFAW